MIHAGHLPGKKPIDLKLRKAECESAYCYRPEEIAAMMELCRNTPGLEWLGDIIIGLACTGLRISELAALRWGDLDLVVGRLTLTDETARTVRGNRKKREIKSSRSRSFPIHPDLLKVLKGLSHIGKFVFHGPRRGRLKPDTIRRILVRDVITPLAPKFPRLKAKRDSSKVDFILSGMRSAQDARTAMCQNAW